MPVILGLDERTVQLMEDFFKDKTCHACGDAASRYLKRKFYCHACLKGSKWGERLYPVDVKETRVAQREKELPFRYKEVF